MSESICGEELTYGEGVCEYSPGEYPDNKCGLHSDYNDNSRSGRVIQESLLNEFLGEEKEDLRKESGELKGTYDTRLTGLRAFDEWLEVTNKDVLDIGPLSIEKFVRWVGSPEGRGASDNTTEKYVEQVSLFYQYLRKKEQEEYGESNHFEDNPVREADLNLDTGQSVMAKSLKSDDGYVAMSPDEFEKFIDNVPAPKFRNSLLFSLIWETGIRPVEATDIQLGDIDTEKREVKIRSEKTHLNRAVFYGEKVDRMMNIYLNGGERDRFLKSEDSDYLFCTNQSESLTVTAIQQAFRKACEESGIDTEPEYTDAKGNVHYRYTPYSLRHGFAERMIDRPEIDTVLLRDAMGHKSVQTTEIYLNRDKETRRRKIQQVLS